MALCEGCQTFKDRVFNLNLMFNEKERICIHTTYEEPSACAESICDMCKFIRRVLWYCHMPIDRYLFRRYVEDPHQKLGVYLQYGKKCWPDYLCCLINVGNILEWEPMLKYPLVNYLGPQKAVNTRGASPTLEQNLELSRQWLATCKSEHKKLHVLRS